MNNNNQLIEDKLRDILNKHEESYHKWNMEQANHDKYSPSYRF